MVLTPILTSKNNKCLKQEYFSENFKISQAIPVPKTTSPKELVEFRPVYLLTSFSKIFEKILKDRIMKFKNKNNILSPNQVGFCIHVHYFWMSKKHSIL